MKTGSVYSFCYFPRHTALHSIEIPSTMASSILVTGGAGYIGSHTVLQLLLGGYKAVVVDNLDNASEVSLNRVKELAAEHGSNLSFHKVHYSLRFFFFLFSGFMLQIKYYLDFCYTLLFMVFLVAVGAES